MIEINNVIELQTHSVTETLCFATQYLVDKHFTFRVSVVSNSFCGVSHFCLDRASINSFCKALHEMHSSLSGSASLNDTDSDAFVILAMEQNGHVLVVGQVGGSDEDHTMRFRFQTDQTCIIQFIDDFKKLLNEET